ncbi:MAG TPA: tryptophan synthase subunit alpha [Candidatus Polarisedimenticolia bacterium]|nr:tryptophan synthase subunit alpha [Candidatus Polarisedimenticolia bacterium]
MSGRIGAAFERARQEGRPALIPYVTAGDPDLVTTRAIVGALRRAGADVVEIGVPFSDPIADGPVNQRAAERALRQGVGLRSVLGLIADLKRDDAPPLVLFTYYNPIHRMGIGTFARQAAEAGVDGVLVTDLPPEEAAELSVALRAIGIDLIFLLSPTSTRERVDLVLRQGRGFLYFISRTGVTGARQDLPPELEAQVRAARAASSLPVAVGFGISRPEQVRQVSTFADGVVVGSALVHLVEEAGAARDLPGRVEAFCRALMGR